MRLKKTIVVLQPSEAQQALAIEMDGNPEAALDFLCHVLVPRIKRALHEK